MKTKLFKSFSGKIVFSSFILVCCFGITAISYGQAVVSINPAEVVSPAVGQQMTVTIKIANGTRVAGYDLTIGYDTSALQYVEITNSTYLPTGAFVAPVKVSSGRIIFAATSLANAVTARSGTLATLKFKVLAVKRSTLRLVDVVLADPDGNALAVTKRDANVVVTQSLQTDINGDGRVNVQDLVLVARDLGKTGSLATDLNKDNRVNVQDLVLVARDLGKTTGGDTGDADAGDADTGDADTGDADTGDADPGDADTGDADPGDADPAVTPPTSDWQVTIIATDPDGRKLNTTGTGPIAVNTFDEIAITVQLKYKGKKASGDLLFSVEGKTGFKLAKSEGTTDNNAEVQNVLTIGNLEGNYKFIVKKTSIVLGESAITLKELIFKATEGENAAAASIEIIAPNAVDPADKTISITAKVKTAAGHALNGAPVTIKRLSGPAIQKLSDKRPVTNNKGEVNTLLRLTSSSTGKLKIQVYTGLASSERTVDVRHTLGSVSFVNGLSSSITTGLTDTIEVRALSRSRTPMSGVSLKFSENSSQLRFTKSSGTTSSSGKFSTIVQTKGKTSGSWSGTTYRATGSEKITVTASHTARYGNKITKTITASTKVIPKRQERQTPAAHFKSDQDWWPNWYWTDWVNLSLPSDCNRVLNWWGYATVSVVDDPFVDEENITREDESSIQKIGTRTWRVRVHIKEHVADPTEVWVRVKANCEVIDSTFGAPSLQQPQPYPETYHLSEIWQELSQVPSETALLANYPNPFNPETWLPYQLSEAAEVTLTIYSMDGNLVRRLDLGHKAAGFYQNRSRAAYWDGRNKVGERVASGIYFYTLTAGDFSATRKMLIVK